jgi:hypothetical protein
LALVVDAFLMRTANDAVDTEAKRREALRELTALDQETGLR